MKNKWRVYGRPSLLLTGAQEIHHLHLFLLADLDLLLGREEMSDGEWISCELSCEKKCDEGSENLIRRMANKLAGI